MLSSVIANTDLNFAGLYPVWPVQRLELQGQLDEHDAPTKIYRHSASHLERFRIQFQEGQGDGRQIAASRD